MLIVDDDPDQLGLLTAYFARARCSVIGLADAEQALALPPDLELDLMVLDLRLPGMDGWELANRPRARYPRCPIAIISGPASPTAPRPGRRSGTSTRTW